MKKLTFIKLTLPVNRLNVNFFTALLVTLECSLYIIRPKFYFLCLIFKLKLKNRTKKIPTRINKVRNVRIEFTWKLIALVLRQLELVAGIEHLRESEVSYFDYIALAYQNIARGQIAMHAPRALQILHAARDLRRHVNDLLKVEIYALGLAHILEQRAIAHILGDDEYGLAYRAHTPQFDQLLVAQLFHDLELFAELFFAHLVLFGVALLLVVELERFNSDHESIAPQAL